MHRWNNSWKLRAKEANHREVSEHANDHIVFYSLSFEVHALSSTQCSSLVDKVFQTDIWFKHYYCSWDVANTEAPLFLQHRHFNLYIPELPQLVEQFISEIYAHEI